MTQFTLKDILAGWRAAGEAHGIAPLLGGVNVPDVDILIDDGAAVRMPEDRTALRGAHLLWVPADALRDGPYGTLTAVMARHNFSGANRHRRGTMRTISLFREFAHDPDKLEKAAVLAALVGARNHRTDLAVPSQDALKELLQDLGFLCLQEIWARADSAPMPVKLPEVFKNVTRKRSSGAELGEVLRLWHDIAFRRLMAVRATPVRGGMGPITLADYDEVIGRYSEGLNGGHGADDWKTLTNDVLARLVWETPRSQLAVQMGVSDVAIAKRCRKAKIDLPPRGYWQRMEAEIDPRPLLELSQITPPSFVERALAERFEICRAV